MNGRPWIRSPVEFIYQRFKKTGHIAFWPGAQYLEMERGNNSVTTMYILQGPLGEQLKWLPWVNQLILFIISIFRGQIWILKVENLDAHITRKAIMLRTWEN